MSTAIDKKQARRAFSRHRGGGDLSAVIAGRLSSRLDELNIHPHFIADIGGNGEEMAQKFTAAQVTAVDFALPRLRGDNPQIIRAQGDAEQLPLGDAAMDLAWSNLCFEWTNIKTALTEAARILRPQSGVLIFSTLGRDTLREARAVFGDNRVHSFMDMHDIGDLLGGAGFLEPVLETEHVSLTYRTAADAMREVHLCGGGGALVTRPRNFMGKTKWRQSLAEYESRFADKDGRITATYEIIYVVSWRKAAAEEATKEQIVRFAKKS